MCVGFIGQKRISPIEKRKITLDKLLTTMTLNLTMLKMLRFDQLYFKYTLKKSADAIKPCHTEIKKRLWFTIPKFSISLNPKSHCITKAWHEQ